MTNSTCSCGEVLKHNFDRLLHKQKGHTPNGDVYSKVRGF